MFQSNLVRDWWRGSLTWRTAILVPLSWAFGACVAARRLLYRAGWLAQARMPVPVIIVGNITVGGSGKTPLTIHLVETLRTRGFAPGVVSRGHGGSFEAAAAGPREVTAEAAASECGDEPLLIRRRAGCPVFVGARRADAASSLLATHPDIDLIIADDGLQHLALARDFEIAVFDERMAGNGRLLPAGPLREPVSRLSAVDAIVARAGFDAPRPVYVISLELQDFYRLGEPQHTCAARLFGEQHGPRVAAVAGIGEPARFFTALRALGLEVEEHAFADHHHFVPADLAAIGAAVIVMTEKDALKCECFGDARVWVAPVSVKLDARLVESIVEKLRGPETARHPRLPDYQGAAGLRP